MNMRMFMMMRYILRRATKELADFMRGQKRNDFLSGLELIGNIFEMMGIHDAHHHFFIHSQRDI